MSLAEARWGKATAPVRDRQLEQGRAIAILAAGLLLSTNEAWPWNMSIQLPRMDRVKESGSVLVPGAE